MFFSPILSKFINFFTIIALLKWLIGNIGDEPGGIWPFSFVSGGFGELKVLFRVGGVGCLVHFFSFKIDGVESEINLAVCDVIRVLFEQI